MLISTHTNNFFTFFIYFFIMLPSIFTFHRYNDGSVKLRNPNIELMDQDILYHLALGSGSHDLHEMFGDVKVPGSSPKRYKPPDTPPEHVFSNTPKCPFWFDFQFVCMGGTPKRMETFAHFIMDEIGYKLPAGTQLQDISAFSYRYSMYKVCSLAFCCVAVSVKYTSIFLFFRLVQYSPSAMVWAYRPSAFCCTS